MKIESCLVKLKKKPSTIYILIGLGVGYLSILKNIICILLEKRSEFIVVTVSNFEKYCANLAYKWEQMYNC